jgi:hypothetical protein
LLVRLSLVLDGTAAASETYAPPVSSGKTLAQ